MIPMNLPFFDREDDVFTWELPSDFQMTRGKERSWCHGGSERRLWRGPQRRGVGAPGRNRGGAMSN